MTEDTRLDDTVTLTFVSLNICLYGKVTLTRVCVSGHLTEAVKRRGGAVYIGRWVREDAQSKQLGYLPGPCLISGWTEISCLHTAGRCASVDNVC